MKKTVLFIFALISLVGLKAQTFSTGNLVPVPTTMPFQVTIVYSDSGSVFTSFANLNPNGFFTDSISASNNFTSVEVSFTDCNGNVVTYTATSNSPNSYQFGAVDYCPTTPPPTPCSAAFASNQSNIIDSAGNVITAGVVMISNSSQGQNLTYTWDFGDGSPAYTGVNFLHNYSGAGPYVLCLTISSPATGSAPACSDTYCDTLTVNSNGILIGKTNSGFSIQSGNGSDESSSPTSINTIDEAISLNIYPNPAKDFITIALDSRENAQVIIYDLTGKMVQQNDLNGQAKVNVSIENLNKGIYLVKVKTEKGFITRKLSVK